MSDAPQVSGFIDPPGDFAPAEEWQSFLEEMEAVEQPRPPDVENAITLARARLEQLDPPREEDFADLIPGEDDA